MNIKELLEKRAALLAELNKPETTAERFAEIRAEIEKINFTITELRKDEQTPDEQRGKGTPEGGETDPTEAEYRAARLPNGKGVVYDQSKEQDAEQRKAANEKREQRGKDLKAGKAVSIETRAAVTTSSTALSTVASGTINPAFEQVGTLDTLVNTTHLEGTGAEAYKKPFVKKYSEGEIVAEGSAPTGTHEPTFGYATINKVKIVTYAEVTEEVEKLPDANYDAEVTTAVVGAWKKKLISQIINGDGSDELVGIVNAPTTIIEATQRTTIATIDENTLDNIIFDYGGDEDVEGDAYLILNKLTLKEFAKVKGTDKRRAYDIVIRGNSGTINGVPFVCTSKLAAFGAVTAGNPYLLYGKLSGYELAYFSDLEVKKSTDYKFKEGVIAFKVTGIVGGSPAMFNGFMSVQKAAKV